MTLVLLALLACGEDPDPEADCREAGHPCCADADCGADEICHISYTCVTRSGKLDCAEPIGDFRCHALCTADSGGLGDCPSMGEACQTVEHVQGEDFIETVEACF
ncbi:MAG: hypothetical protein H6739_29625 [Alphaproteobacteria bacterium]|nr:hypothetical protein [Alphaproteobacteria bacterium]